MSMANRLNTGGRIDRSRTLRCTFDGVEISGHPGDTLASAWLAAGNIRVASSLYRQRPRGVVGADCGEPNAMVQVAGAPPDPMLPATQVELRDGMVAESLSGLGRLSTDDADTTVHDKKYVHADVVVVGGGPAGLAAALAAGRSGARVFLIDENPELGGSLLDSNERINDRPALEWVSDAEREFAGTPEMRVLTRATAVGYHQHNYLVIAERRENEPTGPRQRLWHVRAQHVVLATGAHERPIVFSDNDRPGIMLASAVRRYLNRYAVCPGQRAVVFTTSDSAYSTAVDLLEAGAQVPAVVDARSDPPKHLVQRIRSAGGEVHTGSAVIGTRGDSRLTKVRVSPIDEHGLRAGTARDITADLLAVSGGWSPAVHLFSQAGGAVRWDDAVAGFVPEITDGSPGIIGSARGTDSLAGCLAQGMAAGTEAATRTGFRVSSPPVPHVEAELPSGPPRALFLVPGESGTPADWQNHFVDLRRDSTVADVWQAVGAGMRSVEHVKRYTTIGTGGDQGKTSAVNAIGVIADALMADNPGEVGTTTFRPPYTPVSFALLAGRDRGGLHDPVRTTPMHRWHVAAGAEFENVGQWKRPWYYPAPGEDMDAAVARECHAARTGVAMMDATTLGKIEVVGPDSGEFLNRVYTNGFAKLPVGKARYGMMCGADGMVFDDGVTMRLAPDRYLMSTTTGNALAVLDWLEEWLQTEWPDLSVWCTSVTEQWSTIAVVGPDSRAVLERLAPDLDVSAESFEFMGFRETTLRQGVPARICRISFSGELAFEINIPAWYGLSVWEDVVSAGADYGITPYGTETMHVLRAEKGFVIVGQDTDGTVTPYDLGMDWVVSQRKEFIGKRSFARTDTAREGRKQLVGLLPVDPSERIPEGTHLVSTQTPLQPPVPMLGHVTSSYHSVALERSFALALIKDGRDRHGTTVDAVVGDRRLAVEITKPIFYDVEGARRDGRQPA